MNDKANDSVLETHVYRKNISISNFNNVNEPSVNISRLRPNRVKSTDTFLNSIAYIVRIPTISIPVSVLEDSPGFSLDVCYFHANLYATIIPPLYMYFITQRGRPAETNRPQRRPCENVI